MTDTAKTQPAPGDPAGAVDEFAHIPRSRARHPIVAAAGALLAFFLVFHSRGDIRYALSSRQPTDLGAARVMFAPGHDVTGIENRLVRVAGAPDRESALELDTKGSWTFSQLFRVLGTGDRLFVHRRENPLPAERAEADVFEGRLTRVDDLPYAAAIRAYFAKHVSATHFFAPEALTRALAGRQQGAPLSVIDRGGDVVSLGPAEELAVEVSKPDEVRLGLPRAPLRDRSRRARRDRIARRRDCRVARPGQGGAAGRRARAGPLSSAPPPPERWTFVTRFPADRRTAALGALGDIDRTVEIRDARETIATRASELAVAGEGDAAALVIRPAGGSDERKLAARDIAAIRTMAPVVIPEGAYLLTEGDIRASIWPAS